MKGIKYILLLLPVFWACQKDEIDVYQVEDSAVNFVAQASTFSLRGNTEPTVIFEIPVELVGPTTPYDRQINVSIVDSEENTAVENQDFKILESVVKAGELSGYIKIEVKAFDEGVEELATTLRINPNEYFRAGYPSKIESKISWSENYARPANEQVWRAWFYFFCNGYSRELHRVIITVLGEEVETYTAWNTSDETITTMSQIWWYAAANELRTYVATYDREHPDAPLMHSDDYESYTLYTIPVGGGQKPSIIPRISQTWAL